MKQGMKFPPQIDPVTGRFLEAELEESVKDSIYLILMTQREEPLFVELRKQKSDRVYKRLCYQNL